ncbi:CHRD domain-containing protein [Flavobacteriaceae bacterium MAR_2010_105]|nr:CHRD domain-containing protein [Flavobacteriaceae bacterium MAR_2010_105]
MKTRLNFEKSILLLLFFSFSVFGCSNEPLIDSQLESTDSKYIINKNESNSKKGSMFHFTAHLNGKNEVPPFDTDATGQAIVRIAPDESWIAYKLIVANIENVTASHFHMAPAGANGGVVAFLFMNPDPQPSGPANGVIAEGVITSENVIGNIAGDLSALIEAIRSGTIYVNVHSTNKPSGEIRGQL